MPGKKAMVVISNGKSTHVSGALERTAEQLRLTGTETAVFDKVGANPLKAAVEEEAAFAREHGCDFAAALGVGSVCYLPKKEAGERGVISQCLPYIQFSHW